MLAACLLVLALAAPAFAADSPTGSQDCIQAGVAAPTTQLYPDSWRVIGAAARAADGAVKVSIATNFEVTYYPSFKVVNNTMFGEAYVLYPCGVSPPDLTQHPELSSVKKTFKVPLQAVAASDTTALSFLKALNVRDRVKYVPSQAVDPCMQALADPVGCNRTYSKKTNTGLDARFTGYSMDPNDTLSITFTATADPGALNRAEYVKYIAPFFNKERQANAVFDAVVKRYNDLKAKVAALPASSKPLVAWLSYQGDYCFPDTFVGCAEHVTLYNNAYRRDYLNDAGGLMLDMAALRAKYGVGALNSSVVVAATGSLELYNLTATLPLLRKMLKGVQVVVDEASYNTVVGNVTVFKAPKAITTKDFLGLYGFTTADQSSADYPFLKTGNILRVDGQANAAGNIGWFEDGVAQPDVVLQDFVIALSPAALANTNAAPTFVRAFGTDNVNRVTLLSASMCPLQGCALPARVICPTVYKACDGSLAYTTAETAPCSPTCPPVNSTSAADATRITSPLALLLSALGAALLRALL